MAVNKHVKRPEQSAVSPLGRRSGEGAEGDASFPEHLGDKSSGQ